MIITHHKGEFFKVSFGETTLAFNPISKQSKILKTVKFGADIALVSLDHPDFNGVSEVERKGKDLFVIDGPGEYEVKSVFVHGVPTQSGYESKKGGDFLINTIYAVSLEGMNILYLGALKDKEAMDFKITEDMEGVDILFVPIGDGEVLSPSEAHSLAVSLEAKVIIPMHFDGIGSNASLREFLKEAGQDDAPVVDKLTLKKRDVDTYQGKVFVVQS